MGLLLVSLSPCPGVMNTLIIPADHPEAVKRAVEVLQQGGLVAFPTDTVYGVGAQVFDAQAVTRLYQAKERPFSKAIPLLLADIADLSAVAEHIPPLAERLAARFWPGPLTLVLRKRAVVPDVVTAGGGSVAVRVPDHLVARLLLAALGAPLAATSANRSGQPDPVTAEEVVAQLGGRVELVLNGGPCLGGVPSTVLDLTVSPPTVLRPGPVSWETLQPFCGMEETDAESSSASSAHSVGEGERMPIAIGSDHAGYALKVEVARWLAAQGYPVRDLGTDNADASVDYPDFARAVAQAVAAGECDLGIAICGTGIGVSITANKVPGVRAAVCTDTYMARMSRQHNDANVLCLGGRVLGVGLTLDIVAAWLAAAFEGGRHARRVAKYEPVATMQDAGCKKG